jgi:hypothetical protein
MPISDAQQGSRRLDHPCFRGQSLTSLKVAAVIFELQAAQCYSTVAHCAGILNPVSPIALVRSVDGRGERLPRSGLVVKGPAYCHPRYVEHT